MRIRAGRPLNWRWHWRRFTLDAETLGLPLPEEALVREELRRVAPGEAIAKVTLTRGVATRGYRPDPAAVPTRIVAAFDVPAAQPDVSRDGVAVRRCALVLSEQPAFAGAKTLNRLENVLARAEWDDATIAEGLLGDARGGVVEGTMSNVFAVVDGVVVTPSLDRCGVVGAQRERVRELLAREGIPCHERALPWDAFLLASEAFLTNSVIGVWPVRRMDARAWAVGPVTRRAQALVEADDALA